MQVERALTLALLIAAAGCGMDSGGGGGGGGDECIESADDCAGESICVTGSCVAAFGRIYTISRVAVQFPTQNPSGSAWDTLGGAPDPLLTVTLNGAIVLMPPSVADTFSTTFPQSANVNLPAGSNLTVQVDDEDVSSNDAGYGCQADPLTADILRGRTAFCSSGDWRISFSIEPK